MKKGLILLVVFVFSLSLVVAHQPRIVFNQDLSSPKLVENPEISQAFYGELNGHPDFFKIDSSERFNLYVGILSPAIPGTKTNFNAEISGLENPVLLYGEKMIWVGFHEEFANDDYFKGPEFERNVSAGTYVIKVDNFEHQGKYVLAIGKIESFSFKEIINTMISLPILKRDFFEKSIFLSYYNLVGAFLLGILIFLIILILLIVFLIRRIFRKKIVSKLPLKKSVKKTIHKLNLGKSCPI